MFEQDVSFLRKYTDVVVLSDGQASIAVCPAMQGRVMTSTAGGPDGLSYGWINREFIEKGENNPHINPFGGEDRIWFGPEGGQFSLFFAKDDPFDLEHWFTPPAINEEAYPIVSQSVNRLHFEKVLNLKNYSNTEFQVQLNREVRLVKFEQVASELALSAPQGLGSVAFESINTIKNAGDNTWEKSSGLISIWMLGMFNPSPATTVVIPFVKGPESELGPVVNDTYFGKVPEDRLRIDDDVLFFRCDGEYRSKIGLSPSRCKSVMGSWDADNQVLTLVTYTRPEGAVDYVNSMWEIQDKPFAGDVVNSYNDGPPEPGVKAMGPFYELESSSPAAALAPGESMTHVHRTVHLQGDKGALNQISEQILGVAIEEIESAF